MGLFYFPTMPYYRKRKCVYKEGDDKPIKCHSNVTKAKKHLMALNLNVSAKEGIMAKEATRIKVNAPNYMEAADVAQACLECRFSSYDNKCRLYDFTYEPWFTCESWQGRETRPYFEATIRAIEAEDDKEEFEGKEWEITIIGPSTPEALVTVDDKSYIKSLNNRLYSVEAIEQSVNSWDGIKVYDNHLTDEQFAETNGMRSPAREWLGTIVKPFWDSAAKALKGTFKVVEDAVSKKLLNAHKGGILGSIGLSIDTIPILGKQATVEGVHMPTIDGFEKIFSVDLVGDPAAGGGFNRLLASAATEKREPQQLNEEYIMNPDEVKELIKAEVGVVVADAIKAALAEAEPPEVETPEVEEVEAPEPAEVEENDPVAEAIKAAKEAKREADIARCELMLDRKVAQAKLTGPFEKTVRDAFTGKIFTEKELDGMIKNQKEAQALTDPTGRATEAGRQRGEQMTVFDEADKMAMMFARKVMLASGRHTLETIEQNQEHKYVKPRVFEAYNGWVKAGKPSLNYNGRISELIRTGFLNDEWSMEDIRFAEALTLATVIKNTVNIMVALDYMGTSPWYEPVVDVLESDNPIDDFTLARLFGAEALDVVAKGAAYTEMVLHDEEEVVSHVKQGNYLAVHLEDLLADKINYFVTLPSRLADAWSLTLSNKVASVFTTNTAAGPVLSDTGALFNATAVTTAGGHANLLTAALSWAGYDAVITAMTNQTRRPLGAGQKITNMGPFYLLHPNGLRATATAVRDTQMVPGSANFQINPYGPDGGTQRPNLVNVPDWTDANDWAVLARYNGMSPLKLIFPRGMLTPEIFVADSELAGAMFTNDTIRYKIRMMTYRFSATYDVAPVTDWRLMHKNNVT
jgi:hypothetical protein